MFPVTRKTFGAILQCRKHLSQSCDAENICGNVLCEVEAAGAVSEGRYKKVWPPLQPRALLYFVALPHGRTTHTDWLQKPKFHSKNEDKVILTYISQQRPNFSNINEIGSSYGLTKTR